jgi:uncharacterized protein
MSSADEIASPCIGVCSMNDETGFCLGCYRTLEEIQGWDQLGNEEKSKVISELDARMEASFD